MAENVRPENAGRSKMQGWKMQGWKMWDQYVRVEYAGLYSASVLNQPLRDSIRFYKHTILD